MHRVIEYIERLRLPTPLTEFVIFVAKEARSAMFAGAFLALLMTSHYIHIPGVYRYDFLFFAGVMISVLLYALKFETREEVAMIAIFHIIGLALEAFKTNPAIGSWAYPEAGYTKIGTVPLYSGFMYAAIGSYIAHAWRVFDLHARNFPMKIALALALACYVNFFTNHFIIDFRWPLLLVITFVLRSSYIDFTVWKVRRSMPLLLSFALIAFFVWLAENIGTFYGAWIYPDQVFHWQVVGFGKISSWIILVIISFILIARIKNTQNKIIA